MVDFPRGEFLAGYSDHYGRFIILIIYSCYFSGEQKHVFFFSADLFVSASLLAAYLPTFRFKI